MLNLSFIREHPDLVRDGARKKGEAAPVEEILRLDTQRRETLTQLEHLKAEQNRRSAAMAKARDQAAIDALRGLKDEVKALEQQLAPIDARLSALLLEVPNPPDPSVPEGKDASANPTIRPSSGNMQRIRLSARTGSSISCCRLELPRFP